MHEGHKLFYVLDRATVQVQVTITPEGDVTHAPDAEYEIIDFDGDAGIWCGTCNKRVYGGWEGLSEDWQVV
jgi:hypothetical protein